MHPLMVFGDGNRYRTAFPVILDGIFQQVGDQAPALVAASAIGYYGDTGDDQVDETAPQGTRFLADVVREWEAAADPASRDRRELAARFYSLTVGPDDEGLQDLLRREAPRPFAVTPVEGVPDEPISISSNIASDVVRRKQSLLVQDTRMDERFGGADSVILMADGVWAEKGPPEQIFTNPKEERTRQFLAHIL